MSRCNSFEAAEAETTIEQLREELQSTSVDTTTVGPAQASQSDYQSLELRTLRARMETVNKLIMTGNLDRAWINLPSIVRAIEYMSSTCWLCAYSSAANIEKLTAA